MIIIIKIFIIIIMIIKIVYNNRYRGKRMKNVPINDFMGSDKLMYDIFVMSV